MRLHGVIERPVECLKRKRIDLRAVLFILLINDNCIIRLYASAVCPYSIESISYVDHNEGCEQMISGKSQIRCRIPHSKGLWCVGPFIALVLLFTAIVPVNEVGEGLNLSV